MAQLFKRCVQRRLRRRIGFQEDAAHEIVRKVTDQVNVRAFKHHCDGRRLVAAEPEIFADALDHRFRRR